MNWLQRMMLGRNGSDLFCLALLVLSMLMTLISSIFGWWILWYLAILPLAYACFRMLSRNIPARQRENQWFLRTFGPVMSKMGRFFSKIGRGLRGWNDRRKDTSHRYFKCPNCKQRVRVPAGHGKIRIICPKCKQEFIRKS